MTPEEAQRVMMDFRRREQEAYRNLIPAARAAINVLRDQKMNSTAAELEAQLFVIDTVNAELTAEVEKAPEAFLEAMFKSMRDQR